MHHVGILYDQFMMHGQRNIKLNKLASTQNMYLTLHSTAVNNEPL